MADYNPGVKADFEEVQVVEQAQSIIIQKPSEEDEAVNVGEEEVATPERPQRKRALSPKAQENYIKQVEKHQARLRSSWQEVFEYVNHAESCGDTLDSLSEARRLIRLSYGKYRSSIRGYADYLHANYTEDSIRLLSTGTQEDNKCDEIVQRVLKQLEARTEALVENVSQAQRSSRKSSHTSTSSPDTLRARAKASREFSHKVAMLRKQQAELAEQEALAQAKAQRKRQELEVDLDLLKEERICAEAEAEAETYQDECGSSRISHVSLPKQQESSYERTQAYVASHSSPSSHSRNQELGVQPTFTVSQKTATNQELGPQPTYTVYPQTVANTVEPTVTAFSDFTNYLLKKELISSRFTKFTEDPATYNVWKSSFKNVVSELNVNPQEELALLTNWLGPESSKQAMSMRTASSHDPASCLKKIWGRLDERYGAPELVENTLRKKINNFLHISQKDPKRLYDLGDILSEIESVKEDDRYRALLSFYDTSSGVNPVVAKLPYGLQNKWVDRASRYKSTHQVTFPPFSFFMKFIREISTTLNDPSFAIENQKSPRDDAKVPARTHRPI